jgi:chromosome segregation ATPase
MARGITENDVFTACDALVLAGQRPTIERVRQKIGRGSPNTVSPMLDAWFKGLGRRLQDPGAFAGPPDVPDPVLQAAQHFWEVAQATARADIEQQVSERLAPMQAEVERAKHAQALAHAEHHAEEARVRGLREEIGEIANYLEVERIAHASTTTREQAARAQLVALSDRLAAAETQLRESEERARREVEAAHERATGAERRAAKEIETERSARGRADKRAEALEKRLETQQAASAAQIEQLVGLRTSLDHARQETDRLRAANADALQQRIAVDASLVDARLAIERAESEAKATQAAMARLLPLLSEGKSKRASAKERKQYAG